MAERRMFAKTIVTSDAFLDMPATARCLYFTLAMFADDDGFVNNPKSIMRQVGSTTDDMNILIAKKFVLVFDSGVIVIKHWRIHNYIRGDRKHDTKYEDEMAMLTVDKNGAYTTCQPVDNQLTDNCHTEVRLGEVRLGKDTSNNSGTKRFVPPTVEEVKAYCIERGNRIDPERFVDYYKSNGWMVGRSHMKDWKAAVRTWEKRDKERNSVKKDKPRNEVLEMLQEGLFDE